MASGDALLKSIVSIVFWLTSLVQEFRGIFHILGLAGILFIFSVAGGWVFKMVESPIENKTIQNIIRQRKGSIDQFRTKIEKQEGTNEINLYVQEYESVYIAAITNGTIIKNGVDSALWTIEGAVYYCVTTYTLVGFGNLAPRTSLGRLIAIFYSGISIPVGSLVLGELGDFIVRALKFCYMMVQRLFGFGPKRKADLVEDFTLNNSGGVCSRRMSKNGEPVSDNMVFVPQPRQSHLGKISVDPGGGNARLKDDRRRHSIECDTRLKADQIRNVVGFITRPDRRQHILTYGHKSQLKEDKERLLRDWTAVGGQQGTRWNDGYNNSLYYDDHGDDTYDDYAVYKDGDSDDNGYADDVYIDDDIDDKGYDDNDNENGNRGRWDHDDARAIFNSTDMLGCRLDESTSSEDDETSSLCVEADEWSENDMISENISCGDDRDDTSTSDEIDTNNVSTQFYHTELGHRVSKAIAIGGGHEPCLRRRLKDCASFAVNCKEKSALRNPDLREKTKDATQPLETKPDTRKPLSAVNHTNAGKMNAKSRDRKGILPPKRLTLLFLASPFKFFFIGNIIRKFLHRAKRRLERSLDYAPEPCVCTQENRCCRCMVSPESGSAEDPAQDPAMRCDRYSDGVNSSSNHDTCSSHSDCSATDGDSIRTSAQNVVPKRQHVVGGSRRLLDDHDRSSKYRIKEKTSNNNWIQNRSWLNRSNNHDTTTGPDTSTTALTTGAETTTGEGATTDPTSTTALATTTGGATTTTTAGATTTPSKGNKDDDDEDDDDDDDGDEEDTAPVMVTIFVTVVYIIGGAIALAKVSDNLDVLDAVWFLYISMVTAGYGDVVPYDQTVFIVMLPYIFIGLSLMSSVLNEVSNYFTNNINKARSIGQEVQQIITATRAVNQAIAQKARARARWDFVRRTVWKNNLPAVLIDESRWYKSQIFTKERDLIRRSYMVYFRRPPCPKAERPPSQTIKDPGELIPAYLDDYRSRKSNLIGSEQLMEEYMDRNLTIWERIRRFLIRMFYQVRNFMTGAPIPRFSREYKRVYTMRKLQPFFYA